MKNVLVISNYWVEPNASAAGRRMLGIIQQLLGASCSITYACTLEADVRADLLKELGLRIQRVQVNDDAFDAWLTKQSFDLVLYDRFMSEEQFGWRARGVLPNALHVLDTEDLHCLRYARQAAVEEGRTFHEKDLIRDIAFREVASILRCDLSLMISQVEINLLTRVFGIPNELLYYLPFGVTEDDLQREAIVFKERSGFFMIGNFKHAPNKDSVSYLLKNIWPKLNRQLPDATLHIYGAYASRGMETMHDPENGVLFEGYAEELEVVFSKHRVLLAPLRFGAGQKGKLLDAMRFGTPSVTSSIGMEDMCDDASHWGGKVHDSPNLFTQAAVRLYSVEPKWISASQRAEQLLRRRFLSPMAEKNLMASLKAVHSKLDLHRLANPLGFVLRHHTLQSHRYLSKWIMAK